MKEIKRGFIEGFKEGFKEGLPTKSEILLATYKGVVSGVAFALIVWYYLTWIAGS